MVHFFSLLQAAGSATAQGTAANQMGSSSGMVMQIGLIVLLLVVFYFFLIRPQSKKQKETDKMLSSLKKGDRVVTIGGVYGVVTSVREKTIVLKVDENTKMEFLRSAISSIEARDDKATAESDVAAASDKAGKAPSEEK
jgi:preprotein translocase subunit YajC